MPVEISTEDLICYTVGVSRPVLSQYNAQWIWRSPLRQRM